MRRLATALSIAALVGTALADSPGAPAIIQQTRQGYANLKTYQFQLAKDRRLQAPEHETVTRKLVAHGLGPLRQVSPGAARIGGTCDRIQRRKHLDVQRAIETIHEFGGRSHYSAPFASPMFRRALGGRDSQHPTTTV